MVDFDASSVILCFYFDAPIPNLREIVAQDYHNNLAYCFRLCPRNAADWIR